jgi:hypothetical protein
MAGLRPKTLGTFQIPGKAGREQFHGIRQAHGSLNVSASVNQILTHFAGIGIIESGINMLCSNPCLAT